MKKIYIVKKVIIIDIISEHYEIKNILNFVIKIY